MSDWDKVKQFVLDSGYEPEYTDIEGIVVKILLSLDGLNEDLEGEGSETYELETYLNEIVRHGMQQYDYE